MKKVYALILAFCCVSVFPLLAQNVNIYPIVFCATDDPDIGKSCMSDKEKFVSEMGLIQDALELPMDWLNVYTGAQCNKPNLERCISDLQCGNNDVVFFYYSGHGAHAAADNDWLPQMCLNYKSYEQENFVPVKWVVDQLSKKKPRLCIVITDCCNDNKEWVTAKGLIESDGSAVEMEGISVQNLKRLFYESKGTVVATSSKRDQVSWGGDKGGCFSIAFWDEMYRIGQGQGKPDWNTLLELTKKRTLTSSDGKQEPVFTVNINGDNHVDNDHNNDDNEVVVISVDDKALGDAFKRLVNQSVGKLDRLERIAPDILKRFFAANAQVALVGRNLTTVIDLTTIENYVEELALSKTVKGINIVRTEKNQTGKYTKIVITEIR